MKKYILLILLFGLNYFSITRLKAQDSQIDSIKQLIGKATSDIDRLYARLTYSSFLRRTDPSASLSEINAVLEESISKNLPSIIAKSHLEAGNLYYLKGDYINAIISYESSEKWMLKLPVNANSTDGKGAVYNNLGATYSLINDLDNAQVFYLKGMQEYSLNNDSTKMITSLFNFAFIFIDMQEWQKALDYFNKCIALAAGCKDRDMLIQVYSRAAAMCFRLKKFTEGSRLLSISDNYYKKYREYLGEIYHANAHGEYYYAVNDFEAALYQHRKAYAGSLQWNDPYFMVDEAWEIGRCFLQLNRIDSAEKYLAYALDSAKAYNYLPKIRFILNDWCLFMASSGNYKKSYELRTSLLYFTDSLINLQNHNRVLLFDAKFQSESKENQIKQLETDKKVQQLSLDQKNTLNYILVVGAMILLVISLLSWRNYKQKQKLQMQRISELETEKKLLATEAVLKGEEQERSRLAKDLHDGLGGLLSGIKYSFQNIKSNLVMTTENHQAFERGMDMLDTSIKEMRRVAHNMMPEALVKFGLDTALKDFCNDINQTAVLQVTYQSIELENVSIDQTTSITIYRIVQELIHNSMKHAAAKTAIVQLSKTDGKISITVEDDGKGFDTVILNHSKGIGWSNIKSRVDFLNGKLDVQSGPGKGTSVHIELNNVN